jgi:hypothetical protein
MKFSAALLALWPLCSLAQLADHDVQALQNLQAATGKSEDAFELLMKEWEEGFDGEDVDDDFVDDEEDEEEGEGFKIPFEQAASNDAARELYNTKGTSKDIGDVTARVRVYSQICSFASPFLVPRKRYVVRLWNEGVQALLYNYPDTSSSRISNRFLQAVERA